MKLTYLGTAAAEGWPAVFCNCEYCVKAKNAGGRNLRTRSQALVNGDLLIDFPSDTFMHVLQNKLDISAAEAVIFTHSHIDHCAPIDLFFHIDGCYAHKMTKQSLALYGNEAVRDRINQFINTYKDESFGLTYNLVEPYKPFRYKNYTITPLRANHAYDQVALIYLIKQDDGKTLLYLHDTGLLYDDVYEYLTANKVRADFISYDCTYVALPGGGGHLGLDTALQTKDKLLSLGIADEKTVHCVNHFSHNGKLIHDELVPVAAESGFLTAYDGMVVEF